MKPKDYPLIKVFIFYFAGILISYNLKFKNFEILFLWAIIFFIISILVFWKRIYIFTNILIALLFLLLGASNFAIHFQVNELNHKILFNLIGRKVYIYCKVKQIEQLDKNKLHFIVYTDSIRYQHHTLPLHERLLVKFNLDSNNIYNYNFYKNIINIDNEIIILGLLKLPPENFYPEEFSYREFLKTKGISFILESNYKDRCDLIKKSTGIINYKKFLSELRLKLKLQIENNFDQLSASYIKGLLIGDRSDIPKGIKTSFVNAGVIHVLAVSGLHTGYVVLILLALFGRLNRNVRLILIGFGLFIFIHIANLSSSVVRAAIMAIIILASYNLQRIPNLLNSISIAGLIILFINPLDVLNPSFQLSFGAVLSIALIYPHFKTLSSNIKISFLRNLLDLVLISFAVSIGTFPFVASYYEKFSIVSFLSNILIIPMTGIILGGIFLNIFILNILPVFSTIYKLALIFLINLNFNIVHILGNRSFAYFPIQDFESVHIIFYYLFLSFALFISNKNYSLKFKLIIVLLLCLNFVLTYPILRSKKYYINKGIIYLSFPTLNSIVLKNFDSRILSLYIMKNENPKLERDVEKLFSILMKFKHNDFDFVIINGVGTEISSLVKKRFNFNEEVIIEENLKIYGKNFDVLDFPVERKIMTNDYSSFVYYPKGYSNLMSISDISLMSTKITERKLKEILDKYLFNNLVVFLQNESKLIFLKRTESFEINTKDSDKKFRIFKYENENWNEIEWWKI